MTKYQLTKTLRFGLTKVRTKENLSHKELDYEVMLSEYNIIRNNINFLIKFQDEVNPISESDKNSRLEKIDKDFDRIIKITDPDQRNKEYTAFINKFLNEDSPISLLNPEKTLFEQIKSVYYDIEEYIQDWKNICAKTHLIGITKEYYKNLSRKASYEVDKKICSSEIALSSLRGKNNYGQTIGNAISTYWEKTITKAEFLFQDFFKTEYDKMKNALSNTALNHTKVNLVDFRKSFLSLCSLIEDSLTPIVNGSIVIHRSSNESDAIANKFITEKSINDRFGLFDKIREIRGLIKTEGGNILLGRATFNPYTALQKPNLFSEKLKVSNQDSKEDKQKKRDLNKFLDQLKQLLNNKDFKGKTNIELYKQLFGADINKKEKLTDSQLSAVQRAQYFKFKQIPASVRFILADYLSSDKKDSNFAEISALFRQIGVPITPAEDYKQLKEAGKENEFSLDGYPLKVAFDYAWELCAKNVYEKVDFPQQECERFLKDNFDIDVVNFAQNTKFYANLHQIQSEIGNLKRTSKNKTIKEKWNSIYNNLIKINELKEYAVEINNSIKYYKEKPKTNFGKWLDEYIQCKQSFNNIIKYIAQQDKTSNKEFLLYSKILWLNSSCIVALEHFNENPPSEAKINELENKLKIVFDNTELSNEQSQSISIIKMWIAEYKKQSNKKEWIQNKGWNKIESIKQYEDAKIIFGKQRGEQKTEVLKKTLIEKKIKVQGNVIDIKKDITEHFKDIAIEFGKNFAEIRDGLREEYELNKIQYGSVIIEDKNGDRYLLLQDKNANKNDQGEITHLDIFNTASDGDLTLYQVKSLTSKTIKKILIGKKNYSDFFVDKDNNGILYPEKNINKWDCDDIKEQKRKLYEKDLVKSLVVSLTQSKFAIKENLAEFGWDNAIKQCDNLDCLYKIIDQKGYTLQKSTIDLNTIKELITDKKKNCLLLPIVNQNITAKIKNNSNRFTKDWELIFDNTNKDYRIHPEFTIFYRLPTPGYSPQKLGEKRYNRFQMNCNFGLEVIPYNGEYVNKKEQIESFKTPALQEKNVLEFNKNLKQNNPFVIGIDRGINELATLCVTDFNGKIIGNFDIYRREFDDSEKCQKYIFIEKRNILDLSNLRVEKDKNGKSRLIDLTESKVWVDSLDHNKGQRENNQITKLKELYYTRQFVYHLQSKADDIQKEVLRLKQEKDAFASQNTKDTFSFKSELIIPFKCGNAFEHYPFDAIKEITEKYNELKNEGKQEEIRKFYELDASREIKKGIVANMIGVVTYIFKEICHSNARIVLENLCTAWSVQNNALTGAKLQSTLMNLLVDFKDQENSRLAGVGTYSMFEIQLLKKLFKMQIEDGNNYVPAFRSVEDYEKTIKKLRKKKNSNKPAMDSFGIVGFVSPMNTSHKCPICGASGNANIIRHKESNDELECKKCGFYSITDKIEKKSLYSNHKFGNLEIDAFYNASNLKMIESGDDNAAYQIAVKALKNINDDFFKKIQTLQKSLNTDWENDEIEADVEE